VWSPDGSQIAFLRVAGDGCDVVVRRAQDAFERIVMPCPNRDEPHMAWTGDGVGLVYSRAAGESGASGSRIAVAAAASGAERLLTSPPPGLPGDHSPVVSPDGKDIAFVRQISGGIADLYIVPLAGGLERRVTFEDADVEGLTWSDNGRALVFSSDRAGGYTLWRVPAEGGALQFVAGGALRLKNPVASARGDRIAYENWVYDINVWSTSSSGAVERVTSTSDLWNYFPQVSPDGQQVVYVSTASGEQELWLARRDGSGARQLTRFGRVARQEASRSASLRMPRWSPDGRAIVVVAHFGAGSDVFVVEAATGDLTRLTHDSNLEAAPSWSADGSAVLVGVRTRGQWNVWTLPMPNRKDGATPQIALPGAYAAQAATDDVVFFTYADRAGLWRHRTGSHQPDQIAQMSPSDWANWVIATRAVYRIVVEHGIPVVEQLDFEGSLVRRVGELSQMTWPGFSVAPDGRVLYARWERRQSRIMLLETS
jgi:Tol biopolymer transport system component